MGTIKTYVNLIPLLLLINLEFSSGLSVAKFFTPGMILQEAPSSPNIYGSHADGEVTVSVQCEDGEDEKVTANQVGWISIIKCEGDKLHHQLIMDSFN